VPCCAAVGVFVLFAGAVMKVPVGKKAKENERERMRAYTLHGGHMHLAGAAVGTLQAR